MGTRQRASCGAPKLCASPTRTLSGSGISSNIYRRKCRIVPSWPVWPGGGGRRRTRPSAEMDINVTCLMYCAKLVCYADLSPGAAEELGRPYIFPATLHYEECTGCRTVCRMYVYRTNDTWCIAKNNYFNSDENDKCLDA